MAQPKVGEIIDGYRFNGGDPGSQDSWSQGPNAGDVVDGYKFKGGDPSDEASWSVAKAESKGFISSVADAVGWKKGLDFKAPEGATDNSFTAGAYDGEPIEESKAKVSPAMRNSVMRDEDGMAGETLSPEQKSLPTVQKVLNPQSDFSKRKQDKQDFIERNKGRVRETLMAQNPEMDASAADAEIARMKQHGYMSNDFYSSMPEFSKEEQQWGDRGAWGKPMTFAAGEVGTMGSTLSDIGRRTGINSVRELGDAMENWAQKKAPEKMTFADEIVHGFGSFATFFIPGIGVSKGTTALSTISPALAKWAGAGTMAGLEAAAESDQTYKDLIKQGFSESDAAGKANEVFAANLVLLGVTDKVGFFNDMRVAYEKGGKQIAKDIAAKVLVAKGSEGTQEFGQQVIQNAATNKPYFEGAGKAAAIGAIIGGGASAVQNIAATPFSKEAQLAQAIEDDSTRYLTGSYADSPPIAADRPKPEAPRPTPADISSATTTDEAIAIAQASISDPVSVPIPSVEQSAPIVSQEQVSSGIDNDILAMETAAGLSSDLVVEQNVPEGVPNETSQTAPTLQSPGGNGQGSVPNTRLSSLSRLGSEVLPERDDPAQGVIGRDTLGAIEALADKFGNKAALTDHPGADAAQQGDTIFISPRLGMGRGSIAVLQTVGHEIKHTVERYSPEVAQHLEDVILAESPEMQTPEGLLKYASEYAPAVFTLQAISDLAKQGMSASQIVDTLAPKIGAGYSAQSIRKEFTNDVTGNRFAEPSFRKMLWAELARKDANVLTKIKGVLDVAIKTLQAKQNKNGFSADKYVLNLQRVRAEVAKAMAEHVVRVDKMNGRTDAELQLMLNGQKDQGVVNYINDELGRRAETKMSPDRAQSKENKEGVIVGARPGEFDWTPSTGETGNYSSVFGPLPKGLQPPPIQHPTQIGPRVDKLGPAVQKILSSKGVKQLIEDVFGVTNLKVFPTLGQYKGKPEPSFALYGDGMTFEAADGISRMLGFAFAQESTIVTQPVYAGDEDTWPAFYVGNGKKLTAKEVEAVRKEAQNLGMDYSTSIDGTAFKFFFDGSDFDAFANKVGSIAATAGLKNVEQVETRSQFNEAETYLTGGTGHGERQVWVQEGSAGSSSLFGRAVDNLLAPYAKAVGAEGYRFSADLFADRFGLTAQQREYIREALRPKSGAKLSTAGIVAGTEKLEPTKTDFRAKEPRSNNTDIMFALQNRSAAVGQIEPGDYSDHAKKAISQALADEVVGHISRPGGKSAIGWYDAALKRAKEIYDRVFPELKNDKNSEMLFDALLGIASQGNDVHSNSVYAGRMYHLITREGNTISQAVEKLYGTFGGETRAIENNFRKFEELIDRNGYDKMRTLFNKKMTVGEWNAILRRDPSLFYKGEALSVEGAARQKVNGWMVFGPKIGSFINNLHGDYSTLTADLWFSRTWNRILGFSFLHTPLQEAGKYQAFKDALIAEHNKSDMPRSISSTGKAKQWEHGEDISYTDAELDAILYDPDAMLKLAGELYDYYSKGFTFSHDKKDKKNGYSTKSDLRRAAKNWIEHREQSVAAPRNDNERAFQQEAVEEAQRLIKRKTGDTISIADIQAALWYHEKELFQMFGAGDEKAAPADYADAANNFMEKYDNGDLFYVEKPSPRYVLGEKGSYLKLSPSRVADDAQQRGASPAGLPPQFGQARSKSVKVRGVHYSGQERQSLNTAYYGTGLKGEERDRLNDPRNADIKPRAFFYVDEGNGIFPEDGVGAQAHDVDLNNLYDVKDDPVGYRKLAAGDASKMERLILKGGFDGYYAPGIFGRQGVAVLVGQHAPEVRSLGTGYRGGDVVQPKVEPKQTNAAADRVESARNLPAGKMSGSDWKRMVPEATMLEDGKDYYKSDVVAAMRGVKFSPARLVEAWKEIASDEFAFQFPRSDKSDLISIAKDIDPSLRVKKLSYVDPDQERRGVKEQYRVISPSNQEAMIYVTDEKVWVNASQFQSGVSSGVKLYASMLNFAHNNMITMVGDHLGVSDIATFRRTENMLSAALKFGTTDFMRPAPEQTNPALYEGVADHKIIQKLRPVKWVDNDDAHNLESLLRTSYENVATFVPEIKNVIYSRELQDFVRAEQPDRVVTESEWHSMAGELLAGLQGVSQRGEKLDPILASKSGRNQRIATLERAAISNTVLREEGGEGRRSLLDSVSGQLPGRLERVLYSPGRFYSQLERGIESAPAKVFGPAQQVKLWIQSNKAKLGIKDDEIQWTGINEFLDMQGKQKVSKEDVLGYLKANGVKVEEVEKGKLPKIGTVTQALDFLAEHFKTDTGSVMDDYGYSNPSDYIQLANDISAKKSVGDGVTKYSQYVLPGGENYRELLLTLPSSAKNGVDAEIASLQKQLRDARGAKANEILAKLDSLRNGANEGRLQPEYRSSHWEEPNILAHVRFNDRTDADGKRVLFIEEIQSDWNQDGRKKGFAGDVKAKGEYDAFVAKMRSDYEAELRRDFSEETSDPVRLEKLIAPHLKSEPHQMASYLGIKSEYNKVSRTYNESLQSNVPIGPFVTDTKATIALALKRMIAYAVENGYDKVAFVNGEQSADRYDLSKQISEVWYDPERKLLKAFDINENKVLGKTAEPEEIEDYVGKDVAKKLLATPKNGPYHIVKGDGLKVGGEGMKTFYDQIVPQTVNDVLKKLGGGKVEAVRMNTGQPTKDSRVFRVVIENDEYRIREGAAGKYATPDKYESRDAANAAMESLYSGDQTGFTITPSMKEKVEQGMPLFSPRRAPVTTPWATEATGKIDKIIYEAQDKFVDLKRVRNAIKDAGIQVREEYDAYVAEELNHGRAAYRVQLFLEQEFDPLLEEMKMRGIKSEEFDKYLHARHAKERNKAMAKANPNQAELDKQISDAEDDVHNAELDVQMTNGGQKEVWALQRAQTRLNALNVTKPFSGAEDERQMLSGMSNAEATQILSSSRATLEPLAKKVDSIVAGTRLALSGYGLETQDTVDAMAKTYKHYVPLFREMDDSDLLGTGGNGTGSGYSIKGSTLKRATGSLRAVEPILANLMAQREQAIVRGEKALVGKSLYAMALSAPNPDFWSVIRPNMSARDMKAAMVAANLDPALIKTMVDSPMEAYIDPNTGMVRFRANPMISRDPNAVVVRVAGEDRVILFNSENDRAVRLASALKNLDSQSAIGPIKTLNNAVGQITRYISAINTQYNPIFGIKNFIRDFQGAGFNLTTTPIAGQEIKVLGHVGNAIRAIYRQERGKSVSNQAWSDMWTEFRESGAETGYMDSFNGIEDRVSAIQSHIKGRNLVMKGIGPILDLLGDYNTAIENGVRLSAYKAARESGLSKIAAASMAKNLTVNFNRKGRTGGKLSGWYAFFNAAVQGNARIAETFMAGHKGKAAGAMAAKIGSAGIGIGAVLAVIGIAIMGDDWDDIPDFVRSRDFIIPLGKIDAEGANISKTKSGWSYLHIPMALGYHVFPSIGRAMVEMALLKHTEAGKRIGNLLGEVIGALNPMGAVSLGDKGWGGVAEAFAPSFADPFIQLATNQNAFGRPISKTNFNEKDPTPAPDRFFRSASSVGKGVSKALDRVSGGDGAEPGAIQLTPDQIDYIFGQLTGGVGRESLKLYQYLESKVTDSKIPESRVPIKGMFYGETKSEQSITGKYHDIEKKINIAENGIKMTSTDAGREKYIEKHPEVMLVPAMRSANGHLSKINKARKAADARGDKEEVKRLDSEATGIRTLLIDMYYSQDK